MHRRKIVAAFLMFTVLCLFQSSLSNAQVEQTVNFYAWTDKPYYSPGEKGTLFLVVRNDRTDVDLKIERIEIYYPWFSFTQNGWEGNSTKEPNFMIKIRGENPYFGHDNFAVPSDGRAVSGAIKVKIYVDKTPFQYPEALNQYYEIPVNVAANPQYTQIKGLDKIETLLTIQAILTIVCTVIIASTIFLSVRRPQIVWEKEE